MSSQYGLGMSHDLGLPPWDPVAREAEFFAQLHEPHVSGWLTGVVYGPWSCCPLAEFREHVPAELPVRNYPDLCHSLSCEFPVDRWDLCFALAQHREPINPRPTTFGRIIAAQAPYTIGCGCYSEGVSDDVNKYVWTALHWGPDCKVGDCNGAGPPFPPTPHAYDLMNTGAALEGKARSTTFYSTGVLPWAPPARPPKVNPQLPTPLGVLQRMTVSTEDTQSKSATSGSQGQVGRKGILGSTYAFTGSAIRVHGVMLFRCPGKIRVETLREALRKMEDEWQNTKRFWLNESRSAS